MTEFHFTIWRFPGAGTAPSGVSLQCLVPVVWVPDLSRVGGAEAGGLLRPGGVSHLAASAGAQGPDPQAEATAAACHVPQK